MGIHDNAFVDVKGVAEYDVGRLAADAGECNQLRHRLRHFAYVVFDEGAAGILNALGLIAKQTNPPDVILQFLQRHVCVVGGLVIFFEELGRDDVDLLIRALGR